MLNTETLFRWYGWQNGWLYNPCRFLVSIIYPVNYVLNIKYENLHIILTASLNLAITCWNR
jgi:hypothetical protein